MRERDRGAKRRWEIWKKKDKRSRVRDVEGSREKKRRYEEEEEKESERGWTGVERKRKIWKKEDKEKERERG